MVTEQEQAQADIASDKARYAAYDALIQAKMPPGATTWSEGREGITYGYPEPQPEWKLCSVTEKHHIWSQAKAPPFATEGWECRACLAVLGRWSGEDGHWIFIPSPWDVDTVLE